MKNNKIFALVAVIIVAVASIGVVYLLTANNDSEDGTMTDMRGRKVAVPEEINEILCINSCSLQLVSYFDAVDKVRYLDVDEKFENSADRTHTYVLKDKLQDLPRVDRKNAEEVADTGVDLIISSDVAVSNLNKQQDDFGIPVFAINADLEFGPEFYKQILLLGKLFNENERANEIVNGIKEIIQEIVNTASSQNSSTGYACGMNFYGAGPVPFLKTTGDYLPFDYSNVTNIMESSPAGVGKQPYLIANAEIVENKMPDYIFIDGAGASNTVQYMLDNVSGDVPAIANNNVFKTMVYKSWGTNWLNQLINVYYVASVVHEGAFDWNFEDKADSIIQLFYPDTEKTYNDLASAQSGGGCERLTL